jgi:molybdopterin-guanine dinucleotide biosynthesis protein A
MVSALILAGGEGKRFCVQKPLLKLKGRILVDWIIGACYEFCDEIIVIASSQTFVKIEGYFYKREQIKIVKENYCLGPIGGVYEGLKESKNKNNLIFGCDTPFIFKCLIKELIEKLDEHEIILPRWENGWIEPLHSCIIKGATPYFRDAVLRRKKRMKDVIERMNDVHYISVENEIKKYDEKLLSFFNINTIEDYESAKFLATSFTSTLQ